MGFIHTLYYYQVEKSIEDAKKEEARIAKENQQKILEARKNRKQRLMGKPSTISKPITTTDSTYANSANIDAEDLEEAFDM